MLNCRSIPTELWIQARMLLVSYFSRRGMANAEDLAHDTLTAVWSRENFEFEKEEDFLKICYGFARNIYLDGCRKVRNYSSYELDNVMESPVHRVNGLEGNEITIFLEEVHKRAEVELAANEWALIAEAVTSDSTARHGLGSDRMRLHRARKKLAKLTGWRKISE